MGVEQEDDRLVSNLRTYTLANLIGDHDAVGAVGAVVATIAERKRPRLGVWWDDNAQVVAVSLATMAMLAML